MGKKDEMQVFVCQTCGTVSNAEVKSCFRCGKENILKMPESSLRAFEKEATRCYTEGQFYRMDDLRRIEPYFFKANQFVPGFLIPCGDYDGRIFTINKEKTHYYCSPTYENQNFVIRDVSQIKSVEIKETAVQKNALASGLLGGYTGVLLSNMIKHGKIRLMILTSDTREPEVNLPILSEPEMKDSEMYTDCYETAEKISRELKEAADIAPATGGGLIGQLKELAELKEQGFLTEEEFAVAKKKLLNI